VDDATTIGSTFPSRLSRFCFVEVASPIFVPLAPCMNRVPRPSSKEMSSREVLL
jgi:hypothetical protein